MIFVLTVGYLVLVWLIYFKIKLLPFNLTNKIGVALVGVSIIVGLVLATNYAHPHTSDVRLLQSVIPITTLTSKPARVTEVAVRPNVPVRQGDVLFKVDARPFEYEVKRLEAALAAANQDEPQLEQAVTAAQAALDSAAAGVANAQSDMDRAETLMAQKAMSRNEYDQRKKNLASALAKQREAEAELEQAQLAFNSKIGDEFTSVAEVKQQLAAAQFDLEQTTVVAPEDGFVVNLQIRPGSLVSPSSPVLTFVNTQERGIVVATLPQNSLAHVKPGSPVELAFVMHPGRIFKAEVETIIEASGYGQLLPGGDLPEIPESASRGRYAVRLKLKDGEFDLPMGASGSAVIYTETLRPLAVIQKVTIRMESDLNYIVPF